MGGEQCSVAMQASTSIRVTRNGFTCRYGEHSREPPDGGGLSLPRPPRPRRSADTRPRGAIIGEIRDSRNHIGKLFCSFWRDVFIAAFWFPWKILRGKERFVKHADILFLLETSLQRLELMKGVREESVTINGPLDS